MSDYSHPLCEIPGAYSPGYPSVATTGLVPGPSKPVKTPVDPTGRILAVRFRGDLGKIYEARKQYADDGRAYPPKPEWIAGAINTPVTYRRGTYITLNVTVQIEPAQQFYRLVGDGGVGYLQFEQEGVTSSGRKQYVKSLRALHPLPRKVMHERRSIRWYAQGNGWRVDLGSSGPHDVFVLWGSPIEKSSRYYTNRLTYRRAQLLTSKSVAGGLTSIDAIARRLQRYLNGPVLNSVKWASPDPPYGTGSQYWAILDGNQKSHCFEGSTLMELMLDALGIPAEQHHLHGAITKQLIDYHLDHGNSLRGQQTRKCHAHNSTEELYLLYDKSFQEGQGCCLVNKRLYAVFVKGNVVGVTSTNRIAAHDVLRQLEQIWKPSNPGNAFMVWAQTVKKAGKEEQWQCLAPAVPGVQGTPNPAVPQ